MRLRGLRLVRQRLGMSIGQLAEISDLPRNEISRLEHGQHDADPTLIRRLAIVLGVSQHELVNGFIYASEHVVV